MMALAIWFDELIRKGEVKHFAELAKLGQVSRTQLSNVMNLLLLAPEIQEHLLFLPRVGPGECSFRLRDLQPTARMTLWDTQRQHYPWAISIEGGKLETTGGHNGKRQSRKTRRHAGAWAAVATARTAIGSARTAAK